MKYFNSSQINIKMIASDVLDIRKVELKTCILNLTIRNKIRRQVKRSKDKIQTTLNFVNV